MIVRLLFDIVNRFLKIFSERKTTRLAGGPFYSDNSLTHDTVLPSGMSLSTVIRESSLPQEAARSMPCDSMPFNFAGARFETRMTFFPTISSGEYCFAMPETIVRSLSPAFTESFRSLSEPSTFSAVFTTATRSETFLKSSIEMRPSFFSSS